MARKAGFSHAFATLLSLLVGKVLASYLKPWFPKLIKPLEAAAARTESWFESRLGVELSSDIFLPTCIGLFLAFIWGVLYHYVRHGHES